MSTLETDSLPVSPSLFDLDDPDLFNINDGDAYDIITHQIQRSRAEELSLVERQSAGAEVVGVLLLVTRGYLRADQAGSQLTPSKNITDRLLDCLFEDGWIPVD